MKYIYILLNRTVEKIMRRSLHIALSQRQILVVKHLKGLDWLGVIS